MAPSAAAARVSALADGVYGYLRAFERAGVWETIRHQFLTLLREQAGREPSPTAAILDTQSVKTTEKGALAATMPPRR